MDGLAGDAPHPQKAGEPVGHVLGVAEGDGPLVPGGVQDLGGDLRLLVPVHLHPVLLDVGLVLLVGPDHDLHRVPLVHPGDVHDLPGDGGGEHPQVPPVGDLFEDAGDVFDKAHVQHPVGLVQHYGFHLVQADGAALHVVHEPAGGGHHDLGVLFQLVDLPVDGLAAVEAGHPDPRQEGAQLADFVLDLEGQLPGGGQDEAGDLGAFGVGVLHHGDTEGEGLARAGGGPWR